jgi:hypothetical protein
VFLYRVFDALRMNSYPQSREPAEREAVVATQ